MNLTQVDDYLAILRNQPALLDVRAEAEFGRGAFANAQNLPLMRDAERSAVGTCYKQQGQQAAIALGHQLVSGEVKQARIARWQAFCQQHPDGLLYCARGGLRSQISQQWLAEAGVSYPRVKGGFKALRNAAIAVINQAATKPILLLAGPTGSGKTRLLARLNAVDLEALANHRGSAFGRRLTPQPSQIRFEHDLASALLHQSDSRSAYLLLEDESLLIGQRNIPHLLYQRMQQSPLLLLEEALEDRVEVILQDYIIDLHQAAVAQSADHGFTRFSEMLAQGMARIQKRLGGVLYRQLQGLLTEALVAQQRTGDLSLHRQWITLLLTQYYDPMYQYQLKKRNAPVLMRANATELINWWQLQLTD